MYLTIIIKKFLSVSINYLPRDGSLTSSGRPIFGKLTKKFSNMSNPVGKSDMPLPLGQTLTGALQEEIAS